MYAATKRNKKNLWRCNPQNTCFILFQVQRARTYVVSSRYGSGGLAPPPPKKKPESPPIKKRKKLQRITWGNWLIGYCQFIGLIVSAHRDPLWSPNSGPSLVNLCRVTSVSRGAIITSSSICSHSGITGGGVVGVVTEEGRRTVFEGSIHGWMLCVPYTTYLPVSGTYKLLVIQRSLLNPSNCNLPTYVLRYYTTPLRFYTSTFYGGLNRHLF